MDRVVEEAPDLGEFGDHLDETDDGQIANDVETDVSPGLAHLIPADTRDPELGVELQQAAYEQGADQIAGGLSRHDEDIGPCAHLRIRSL